MAIAWACGWRGLTVQTLALCRMRSGLERSMGNRVRAPRPARNSRREAGMKLISIPAWKASYRYVPGRGGPRNHKRSRDRPGRGKGANVSNSPAVEVEGRRLNLSNLDKVLYPSTGFTKGQVIDYYARIAPALIPHLSGRPVTMKRY